MRRLCIGTAVAFLLSVGMAGDTRHPKVVEAQPVEGVDVPALIDEAATFYRMPEWARQRSHRIAFCESRYDPTAYNHSSGATGVFQWIPTSARWVGINPWNVYENVYAALRLMSQGQWQHWRACL